VHTEEVAESGKEGVGEGVLLVTRVYLEEKGDSAPVALVDQHTVTLTLDEDLGRKDLCIGEITSLENGANEESRGLGRDWHSKRLLVNLTER
jgi:hypothetical protein